MRGSTRLRLRRYLAACLGIVLVTGSIACGSSGSPAAGDASSGEGNAEAEPLLVSATLDTVYGFDGGNSLPVGDRSKLPIVPGGVTGHWYTYEGWYVVVFEGIDPATLAPSCIGTSVLNVGTGQVEHPSNGPTSPGGCDDGGATAMRLAAPTAGVRTCGGTLSFVTEIPADISGTVYAAITAFLGDGTGAGVSGRLNVTAGSLPPIENGLIDCGPLPRAHVLVPPTPTPAPTVVPTPAPATAGSVSAADKAPPPALLQAARCTPAKADTLQDVTLTEAGPYFVHHPEAANNEVDTIIFLSGGSGSRGSAESSWKKFFGSGIGYEAFRVVLPYASGSDYLDEAKRTYAIWHEVLSCYGGDPSRVHLAGVSNGGLAAFALMVDRPEYFATLLGAPGAFPVQDPTTISPGVWRDKLAGRAVFNGAGAFDNDWKPEVIATHNSLASAGIESVFVEFAGQPHIISEDFDERVFLEFWKAH
jgi:pimeloyl-ACP methyl ester carboxylesterase